MTSEEHRLEESQQRVAHWQCWGPYLSERAWGTVREDYSPLGTVWDDFPHDHARSKAYRWGEDGIGGICDRVHGAHEAMNPAHVGPKAAAHYPLSLGPGERVTVRLRFTEMERQRPRKNPFGADFEQIFAARQREADEFYATVIPQHLSADAQNVMRQAFAGLLWSKHFYHYVVAQWLQGDPAFPSPPPQRWQGRNRGWSHLYNGDVISVPDKWEYPWYAAWDLAFHCIPLALVAAELAKQQLVLMLREWYMHPDGQLPAYEWSFDGVNPPVHAWAAWRVYKIAQKRRGRGDRAFLEHVFHKLLLHCTWWVNRKDTEGKNIFQGGFLGLDNIGVFDRSGPVPMGGYLEQSDATAWMGMYCLNMLAIALELARQNPTYENVASKFFEHFVYIAHAMDHRGGEGIELWDEDDGCYSDVLHCLDGRHVKMRVRSMVGLIPLFAVETLESDIVARLPGFKRRMQWFIDNRPDFRDHVDIVERPGGGVRRLLSIVTREELARALRLMLDEAEFLSPYAVRALSRYHRDHPYTLSVDGTEYQVRYEPAESSTGLFGGNSNWRGPVWFPVNYLIIEALQKFHYYFGDDLKVECPTDSGQVMNLWEVAAEHSRRLTRIFLRGPDGRRPGYGGTETLQDDPHWRDLVLFYEIFSRR